MALQTLPDFPPPPIITTFWLGFTSLLTWAGAPATSKTASASFSGISSGTLAIIPDSKKIAWPSIIT